MLKFLTLLLLTLNFLAIQSQKDGDERPDFVVSTVSAFVFWPNGTVPFYINPDHFDQEQTLSIVKAISTFAFKTCIKFAPVMSAPDNQHVLVFVNPDGARRCTIDTLGHSNFQPHIVHLGYDCLKSPQIDMMIMRSLGLPFEHNRMSRDIYINVMLENVEPGAVELFTKDAVLPPELRILPYDHNSVMHFGERDYSRNGRRTIIFKDRRIQQNRIGLTQIDLKKIDAVYNSVCRERDRQEKIDLCQTYPGAVRRKRDTRSRKSLRVNPDITPPPSIGDENFMPNDVTESLTELGINEEVQEIVEKIHKMSAKALKNAQIKYCNATGVNLAKNQSVATKTTDINSILTALTSYTQSMVDISLQNLTVFCQSPDSMPAYERALCGWGNNANSRLCTIRYRSTNIFAKYSTQHRPIIVQSTKPHFHARRSTNETDKDGTTATFREKRDATTASTFKEERGSNTETPTKEREAPLTAIKLEKDSNKEVIRKKRDVMVETSTLPPSVGEYGTLDIANEFTPRIPDNTIENTLSTKPSEFRSQTTLETTKNQSRRGGVLEKRFKIAASRHKTTESDQSNQSADDERQKMLNTETEVLSKRDKTSEKARQKIDGLKKKIRDASFDEDEVVKTIQQKGFKKKKKIDYAYQDEIDNNYEKDQRPQTKGINIEKNIPLNKDDEDENMDYNTEAPEESKKHVQKKIKFHETYNKSAKNKYKWNSRTLPSIIRMSKLNKEFYNERKWPGGLVPYIIAPLPGYDIDDVRERIQEVEQILRKRTCVRLKEITKDEAKGYEDYIVLDNSPDYVTGRVGGKQNFGALELFEGGQHRQHAAMVVMAMLGFYFEVSRHDRDQHIRVHMRHVRPDKLHHFEKIREEATLNLPYDFDSATHPAWQFWRKIGKTGISTVATYKDGDPDGTLMRRIGQNEKLLSEIDIIKINTVYGLDCFEKKVKNHS